MALELATVEDLQAAVPGTSEEVARAAIDRASALVAQIARTSFDYAEHDELVLTGGGRDLVIPVRPLVIDEAHPLTVVECDDLGNAVSAGTAGVNFARVGNVLSKRFRSQVRFPSYAGAGLAMWPAGVWAPIVRVTCTHGYLAPPPWLTAIVVNAAAVYATNPEGLYSTGETLTVGGITTQSSRQWMRSTTQTGSAVTDQIRAELKAVGALPGGAFTITPA